MTSDEVKQSITSWCSSDDDLEIAGDRFEPSTDFAFGLRAASLTAKPVELLVLRGQGADRLTIRRNTTLSGDSADAVRKLIDSRSGAVSATVERSGADTSVTAQTYVYLDGLSKHTFVLAVSELARTSRLLDALGTASQTAPAYTATTPVVEPAATPAFEPVVEPRVERAPEPVVEPAATPAYAAAPTPAMQTYGQPLQSTPSVAQPIPAPSFTPQPVAQQPQPVAQPAPQPMPSQAGQWVPSHSVPPQGLRAWGAPDPAGPVVANLAPGLPIQVAEVRGAWARVICSNGWTGWIDGRIIGVAA